MTLYTRRGDSGETDSTSLGRISKASPATELSGACDEVLTRMGAAVVKLDRVLAGGWADPDDSIEATIYDVLIWSQHRTFTCAACFTNPSATAHPITAEDVAAVERYTDYFMASVPEMRSFVLPGSSELVVRLDLARTAARAAERAAVRLDADGTAVNPDALAFINRLSDLLFAMGRAAATAFDAPQIAWDTHPSQPEL